MHTVLFVIQQEQKTPETCLRQNVGLPGCPCSTNCNANARFPSHKPPISRGKECHLFSMIISNICSSIHLCYPQAFPGLGRPRYVGIPGCNAHARSPLYSLGRNVSTYILTLKGEASPSIYADWVNGG